MQPTSADPSSPDRQPGPLVESPWFWLLLFVNAAILGLLAIGPKYQQREAAIERRYEARRDSALRQATGQAAPDPLAAQIGANGMDERPLRVPLGWLLTALVVLNLLVTAVFVRRRRHPGAELVPLSRGAP